MKRNNPIGAGACLLAILLTLANGSVADELHVAGGTYFGQVVDLSETEIVFDIGCNGQPNRFAWPNVEVKFSEDCGTPQLWGGGDVTCSPIAETFARPGTWYVEWRVTNPAGERVLVDGYVDGIYGYEPGRVVFRGIDGGEALYAPTHNLTMRQSDIFFIDYEQHCPHIVKPFATISDFNHWYYVNDPHLVVMGSYPPSELDKAIDRRLALFRDGIGTFIIETDSYQNLAGGLLALVSGPMERAQAEAELNMVRHYVSDAFVRRVPNALNALP